MIHILIVEDEKPISDLIRMNLLDAGYFCDCAFDGMTGKDILALFQKLNDKGNTIIVISHDREVAQQSKRVISIFDGKLTE